MNEIKLNKCNYINPKNNKKCKNHLGIYPKYCYIHTLLIENVFISKSNIKNAGNGLFAGPKGFVKNDKIGVYSTDTNQTTQDKVTENCKIINNDSCWEYVLCDFPKKGKDTICWDGIDTTGTIMRYINDAKNSKYKNNSYFLIKKQKINNNMKPIPYIIASKNIKPYEEIFVNYGKNYWS